MSTTTSSELTDRSIAAAAAQQNPTVSLLTAAAPTIEAPSPPSAILDRLRAFLPAMAVANRALEQLPPGSVQLDAELAPVAAASDSSSGEDDGGDGGGGGGGGGGATNDNAGDGGDGAAKRALAEMTATGLAALAKPTAPQQVEMELYCGVLEHQGAAPPVGDEGISELQLPAHAAATSLLAATCARSPKGSLIEEIASEEATQCKDDAMKGRNL